MHRRSLKLRGAFPKSADEYTQPMERLLRHRRAEVDAGWGRLEEGWAANNERMATLRVRPRTAEESMVALNVGGSKVSVWWHILADVEGFKDSILGALLEGVWGDGRIPRDSDGRIVLDQSPTCVKLILHTMLRATRTSNGRRGSPVAVGLPEVATSSAMTVDEVACITYTAHVMGLPGYVPAHPEYVNLNESSAILEPFEIAPFGAKVRDWVGGSADELTLIYRATRDGFGSAAFKARCNEGSPCTVSLIRVSSGEGNDEDDDDEDSVVGGYSVHPFDSAVGSKLHIAKEMFVFMLKDGSASSSSSSSSSSSKDISMPHKWDPHPYYVGKSFEVPRSDGPYFGKVDLVTLFDKASGRCTMQTKQYNFEGASAPFLALNGKKVVEIEVYRFSASDAPKATAPITPEPGGDALLDAGARDTRSFGETIATSLMEERMVLDRAVEEMEAAEAKVTAAVGALEAVYGPSVAAGEQDAVVELNVRGTRMTTLRSTLWACPRSALAAMFNEERWPATDKDKDIDGRRLIDCNSTCFSKILDVLRMRKRVSWSQGTTGGKLEEGGEGGSTQSGVSGAVLIKRADVEAFGAAVNMYFPGCENFIMDLVQPV